MKRSEIRGWMRYPLIPLTLHPGYKSKNRSQYLQGRAMPANYLVTGMARPYKIVRPMLVLHNGLSRFTARLPASCREPSLPYCTVTLTTTAFEVAGVL